MAASLLAAVADLNGFLLSHKVHPTLFPYALLPTLHAARVSFVHRALTDKAREAHGGKDAPKTTWAYDLAGFLIMAWGGGFLASFLLGQTPAQLLSIHPFVNYVSVHLFITVLHRFIALPTAKTVDTIVILIDSALRTHAVVMSITMAMASGTGAVQNSLLIQVICGTIGATGGAQLAGTLNALSPAGWSLSTPPALRATSVVEVIDILTAAVCTLVFGVTTLSHPSYAPLLARVHEDKAGRPLFTPTGARAACTLIFAIAFSYRAIVLYWLPAASAVSSKPLRRSLHANGRATTSTPTSKRSASPAKRSRKEQ